MAKKNAALLFGFCFALCACGGGDSSVAPAVATSIAPNSSTSLMAVVGSAVTELPSVIVKDRRGDAMAGVPVTFSVISGGGSIMGATQTTNTAGVATVGGWTLGATAGPNSLMAMAGSLPALTFTAIGTAAAARLAFASTNAGYFYSCAVATSGAAYCWGENTYGQLGDGAVAQRATPRAVAGGLAFESVSAGVFQTCGVTTDRRVYCWGGGYGSTPVPVNGGVGFVAVTVGLQHACGLTASGAAYCWGDNWLGALGTGDRTDRSTPAPVTGGLTFKSLSAGWYYTCGVTTAGAGYCWGKGDALGSKASTACDYSDAEGVINCSPEPAPIDGGHTFSRIGTGEHFTCALTADGAAYCWGWYPDGAQSNVAAAVPGGLTFTDLSVDAQRSCGVATAGGVYCWGWIPIQGSFSNAPTAIGGSFTFASVSVGWYHSCGVAVSGVAYCWGMNDSGELGDGSHAASASPVRVVARP